jgi:hypothetical protein
MKMTQKATGQESPEDLLASIRRLTKIVLDKLEQGSNEGTLDQAQIRLLGSIAMKSLGLWQEALNPRPRRGLRREAQETEEQLSNEIPNRSGHG